MLQTTTARNLMLDRMWATSPGASVEVGLLNGDPALGAVELTAADCPGYARYTVGSWGAFWSAATGGVKSSVEFTACTATAAWDDAGEWDAVFVDGVLFDAAELVDPVVVDGAGAVHMRIARRFNEGV